ncbi:unnamed protein product [Orchesella dallaii]|uniref:Methyl farnesoate epoxidase n=1 Tax=Orchesella dallaii TaxID=48710 RepID=A0ABP1R2N8_9HEXA
MFLDQWLAKRAEAIWWVLEDRHRCTHFPPGPARLPLLGSLLTILRQSNLPALALAKLAKIYGDVMYAKMGMMEAVVFSSHDAAKEIINHEKVNDRVIAGFIADRNMHQNMGVIFSVGDLWQTLRRFTIRTLRDFGFGKTASMDIVINEELTKFLGYFNKKFNSSRTNQQQHRIMVISPELFDLSTTNVLWRLVTGKSYELGNTRLKHLLKLSHKYVSAATNGGDISFTFPLLCDWFPEWTGRNRQNKYIQKICQFLRETINEHRQIDSYAGDPQSFIDVFLAKIDENPKDPIFNDDQLIYTLLDLFQAGADTSSNTLAFALLFLTLNPDKQAKFHEELDAVLPTDGVITAEMKSKLPYCTATLFEVLRFSSLAPLSPNREAAEDFKLRNFIIKKGTSIVINLQAIHFDENVWKDPQVFRPERFLTKDGEVDKALAFHCDKAMTDLLVGFGGGRRVCVGQQLAETSILMYLTTFFRYFKIERLAADQEKLTPSLVPVLGLAYSPRPFEAKVIRRG